VVGTGLLWDVSTLCAVVPPLDYMGWWAPVCCGMSVHCTPRQVDPAGADGAFHLDFLRLGQLAYAFGSVVFVHGGVTTANMGWVPGKPDHVAGERPPHQESPPGIACDLGYRGTPAGKIWRLKALYTSQLQN
jgi:hypothetical protein